MAIRLKDKSFNLEAHKEIVIKRKAEKMERDFEESFRVGDTVMCGCDEVGRGPLAGPVIAAAVIFKQGAPLPEGLNDSKKLTEKKRERLYDEIIACALDWAVGEASAQEIDEINILEASLLAMRRAIAALKVRPGLALIDGNQNRGFDLPATAIVGGDAKCPSISAASIIAKVTRDRLMVRLDETYPGYGFAWHKGYPTAAHYAAIARLGPSEIHRRSFRLY